MLFCYYIITTILICLLFFIVYKIITKKYGADVITADIDDYSSLTVTDNGKKVSLPLIYSEEVIGSAGEWFNIECDNSIFNVENEMNYFNEKAMADGMAGADRGILTYKLYPKKKGRFNIYELKYSRFHNNRIAHRICIK